MLFIMFAKSLIESTGMCIIFATFLKVFARPFGSSGDRLASNVNEKSFEIALVKL